MKVIHVAVWESGGAGIAALRLQNGLLKAGVDSKFICLHKTSSDKNVFQFNTRTHLSIPERLLEKFNIPVSEESRNKVRVRKYKRNYEEFTFPETDINILNSELVKQADIINLHWVGHYLDYSSFFKGINKPVVWTLHDKNPTMGGFHLLIDKEKNPEMADLDSELAAKKALWINECKNLQIVTPSLFLMNYSKNSKALKAFNHYHIPNGVDTNIFRKQDKLNVREIFNLPKEKRLVLFLNSKGFHKGADMVFDIISSETFKHLYFVGLGESDFTNENVSFVQSIFDERLLSLLYSAVDAFLLPSREDNLPNMMLESLACGTPVLATPAGGIPEMIENGFNGSIAREISVNAVKEMLLSFDKNEYHFDRTAIRNFSIKNFDLQAQAKKYIELYQTILNSDA